MANDMISTLAEQADTIALLEAELSKAKNAAGVWLNATADAKLENERLRAALANSELPCIYCSLPKDEWSRCQNGFPGCDRADDAMGCPELGAAMERDALRAELVAAVEHVRNTDEACDRYAAERDALRDALREALRFVCMVPGNAELLVRIDALLDKGGE